MLVMDGKEVASRSDDEDELIFDHTSLLNKDISFRELSHKLYQTGCKLQVARTVNLCLSFFGLGLCFAIPTATLDDLQKLTGAGLDIRHIYTARYTGYLFGSLLGGFLFDRYNRQFLLFLSLLATSIGVIVMPFCSNVGSLMACTAITGITMGFLDTGGNVWCLDLWGRRSAPVMQTLHFCFGLGAFVAPLVAEPFLSPLPFNYSIATANNATVNLSSRISPIGHLHFYHSGSSLKHLVRNYRYIRSYDFLDDSEFAKYDHLLVKRNATANFSEEQSFDNSTSIQNFNASGNEINFTSSTAVTPTSWTERTFKPKPKYADGNQLKEKNKWDRKSEKVLIAPKLTTPKTSTVITNDNSTDPVPFSNETSSSSSSLKFHNGTNISVDVFATSTQSQTSFITESHNVTSPTTERNYLIANETQSDKQLNGSQQDNFTDIFIDDLNDTVGFNSSNSTVFANGTFDSEVNLPVRPVTISTTSGDTTTTSTTSSDIISTTTIGNTIITLTENTTWAENETHHGMKVIGTQKSTSDGINGTIHVDHIFVPEHEKEISLKNKQIEKENAIVKENQNGTASVKSNNTKARKGFKSNKKLPLQHTKNDSNSKSGFLVDGMKELPPNETVQLNEITRKPFNNSDAPVTFTEKQKTESRSTTADIITTTSVSELTTSQTVATSTLTVTTSRNIISNFNTLTTTQATTTSALTTTGNKVSYFDALTTTQAANASHLTVTATKNYFDAFTTSLSEVGLPEEDHDLVGIKRVKTSNIAENFSDMAELTENNGDSFDALSDLFNTLTKKRLGKFEIAYVILGLYVFIVSIVFLVFLCKNPREMRSRQLEELNKTRETKLCFIYTMVGLLSVFLCLYVGIEVAVGEVLHIFASKESLQLSTARGYFLSYLFWGSFTISRFFAIFISMKFSGFCILLTNLTICLVASIMLVAGADKIEALLWLGTVILGLGVGPLFPTSIAWMERYVHVTNKMASLFILGAAIGEIIIPIIINTFINQEPMVLMYVNIIVNALCFVSFISLSILAFRRGEKYLKKPRRALYRLANMDDTEDATELITNSFSNSNGTEAGVKQRYRKISNT